MQQQAHLPLPLPSSHRGREAHAPAARPTRGGRGLVIARDSLGCAKCRSKAAAPLPASGDRFKNDTRAATLICGCVHVMTNSCSARLTPVIDTTQLRHRSVVCADEHSPLYGASAPLAPCNDERISFECTLSASPRGETKQDLSFTMLNACQCASLYL